MGLFVGDDLTAAAAVASLVVVVVDEDEGVVVVSHAPAVVHHPPEGAEVAHALLDLLAVAELRHMPQVVVLVHLGKRSSRDSAASLDIRSHLISLLLNLLTRPALCSSLPVSLHYPVSSSSKGFTRAA